MSSLAVLVKEAATKLAVPVCTKIVRYEFARPPAPRIQKMLIPFVKKAADVFKFPLNSKILAYGIPIAIIGGFCYLIFMEAQSKNVYTKKPEIVRKKKRPVQIKRQELLLDADSLSLITPNKEYTSAGPFTPNKNSFFASLPPLISSWFNYIRIGEEQFIPWFHLIYRFYVLKRAIQVRKNPSKYLQILFLVCFGFVTYPINNSVSQIFADLYVRKIMYPTIRKLILWNRLI